MTIEEALKILYKLETNEKLDTVEKIKAIIKGIVAIKKQIAKKPHHIFNSESLYCPDCECEVGYNDDFTTKWKYCPDCGQALDWSDMD